MLWCRDRRLQSCGVEINGFRRVAAMADFLCNGKQKQYSTLVKNTGVAMKKLKHEAELAKGALLAGMKYAEERGAAVFEPTDSANERYLYIYRLLVHDKLIQPLPEDQVSQQSLRHRLALWYARQLPQDHPLLK